MFSDSSRECLKNLCLLSRRSYCLSHSTTPSCDFITLEWGTYFFLGIPDIIVQSMAINISLSSTCSYSSKSIKSYNIRLKLVHICFVCSGSCYVAQAGIKLRILLPQPPCPITNTLGFFVVLGIECRASCMLGRCSTTKLHTTS